MSRGATTRTLIFAAAVLAAASVPVAAKVVDVGASGATIAVTGTIAAPPQKVYGAFVNPKNWWNPKHSFSGNAAFLLLQAVAGGCFCETAPDGGSVRHMVVVKAVPGAEMVMQGTLGPMMTMGVSGSLDLVLKAEGDGTAVTLTYAIGGYAPDGFDKLGTLVDGVLDETLSRLKLYVETGKPTAD